MRYPNVYARHSGILLGICRCTAVPPVYRAVRPTMYSLRELEIAVGALVHSSSTYPDQMTLVPDLLNVHIYGSRTGQTSKLQAQQIRYL